MKIKLWLVLLAFLFSGCSSPITLITPIPTAELEKTVLAATTPTSTTHPIALDTPTITPSATMLPPSATSLAISTPTRAPMPTIQPTLSLTDSVTTVEKLLQANGNCQLPCIWGFTPSQTKVDDFTAWATGFGHRDDQNSYIDYSTFRDKGGSLSVITLWQKPTAHAMYLSYRQDAEKIMYLFLYGEARVWRGSGDKKMYVHVDGDPFFKELFKYYLVPQILSNYGQPSQVLIYPFPHDPNYDFFSLVLYYPEKGFLVEYIQPKDMGEGQYAACLSKIGFLSVITWSPQSTVTLADIAARNGTPGLNELNYSDFKPIEEVTTMTLDSFYHSFKDFDNKKCITTPIKRWE